VRTLPFFFAPPVVPPPPPPPFLSVILHPPSSRAVFFTFFSPSSFAGRLGQPAPAGLRPPLSPEPLGGGFLPAPALFFALRPRECSSVHLLESTSEPRPWPKVSFLHQVEGLSCATAPRTPDHDTLLHQHRQSTRTSPDRRRQHRTSLGLRIMLPR